MSDRLKNGLEHGKWEHDVNEMESVEERREEDTEQWTQKVANSVQELAIGQDHSEPQPRLVSEKSKFSINVQY